MNNLFTKLRDFVGLNDPVEYEDYIDDDEEENTNRPPKQQQEEVSPPSIISPQPIPEEERPRRRNREHRPGTPLGVPQNSNISEPTGGVTMNNVIGMPNSNNPNEVIIIEPRSFEEMPMAIQALRERKSVILNLTIMDPDQAQRAVDFVAGGTYAIDGHQERIGESIFLFTPSIVQVTTSSGVVHEAAVNGATVQQKPSRSVGNTPTPAWASEAVRMVQ